MKKIEFETGIKSLWWVPMLTGLISIVLGIWTFAQPASAMIVLAYAFAIGLVIAGILNFGYAIAVSRYTPGWGWSLALAIIEAIVGFWLLAMPEIQVVGTFVFVVGFFIIIAAINALCESFALSMYSFWWVLWSIILLVATIVMGIVFLSNPIGGGVVVWFWIAMSFITFGVYRLMYASRLRALR